MNPRKLISFDWALKRLLRSKANYEVLEGFLSELLKDDIKILEILESESNRADVHDRANRVDLKVRNQNQEIILIRLVPVDNSLIFINFMNRLRAKRTDSLTNRFFLLSIRPV